MTRVTRGKKAGARRAARRDELPGALREELARLEELRCLWWKQAQVGNKDISKEATDRILAIQKQRVALLAALRETNAQSVDAGAGGDAEPEIKIVFVDDWRTVRA